MQKFYNKLVEDFTPKMIKSTTTTTIIPAASTTTTKEITGSKYESIYISGDSDDDELNKQVSTLSLEDEIFEELEKVAHDEVKLKEVLKNFDMIYNEYKEPEPTPVLIKKNNSMKKTLMKSKTCSIIESKCVFKKESLTKKCHNNLVDKKLDLNVNKKIIVKNSKELGQCKRPLSRSRSVWELSNSKIPVKNVTSLRRDFIAPINNRTSKDDSFLLQNNKNRSLLAHQTKTTTTTKPKQEYVIGIVNKNKIKTPETAKIVLNKKSTVQQQKSKEVIRRNNDGENINRLSKKINNKIIPVSTASVTAAAASVVVVVNKTVVNKTNSSSTWYQSDCSDDSGHISNENDDNSNITVIGRISEKLLDKFEPEKNAIGTKPSTSPLSSSSSSLKTEVFLFNYYFFFCEILFTLKNYFLFEFFFLCKRCIDFNETWLMQYLSIFLIN